MMRFMDKKTFRESGLREVLDWVPTQTEYGKELKSKTVPFGSAQVRELRRSFEELGRFRQGLKSSDYFLWNLKGYLSEIKDIQGSLERVMKNEVLNEVEFFEIKNQIMVMEELRDFFLEHPEVALEKFAMASVAPLIKALDPENSRVKTFYIYDGYSRALGDIREEKRTIDGRILEEDKRLRRELEQETGVKPKPNNEILVPKEKKDLLALLKKSDRVFFLSETFKSYVFKISHTEEMKALREQYRALKIREEEEEFEIRIRLSQRVRDFHDEIQKNIQILGELDLSIGKILLGDQIHGVEPRIVQDPYIKIRRGRHCIVEQRLRKEGKEYMPIDVTLENGVTLITGANMGGKTITLKLIALITAMAQLGLYVPAEEATIGPVSFIYFSSGDEQSQERGLSTFGAEIYHLKKITDQKKEKGLVLIDELARGTNPKEGYAISRGVIEHFKSLRGISVVTTHFDGLSRIPDLRHLQVVGLRNAEPEKLKQEMKEAHGGIGVLEKYMDYRLENREPGEEVPKEAIMIARLMGLREDILCRAEEVLEKERQEQLLSKDHKEGE